MWTVPLSAVKLRISLLLWGVPLELLPHAVSASVVLSSAPANSAARRLKGVMGVSLLTEGGQWVPSGTSSWMAVPQPTA
ncbi:hypothetical protein GCM10022222_00140 [Amycolatopsis ultiminotia]|uniref:Secreted protein n=1 Tax=Amycolatopsis ultiminotia TaxID=543629 RepID=A0ABP6UTT8_9PSEU